jgi:hypothetical protein
VSRESDPAVVGNPRESETTAVGIRQERKYFFFEKKKGGFKFRSEHPHRAVRSRIVGWQANGLN